MNLYFRLLIVFIRGWILPKIKVTDELTRTMRVLPNDIDINGHLNNGRYGTLTDLLVIEQAMRLGVLGKAFKLGWRPMNVGGLISYRKQLAPLEKFSIHYQMECWDEKWAYMRFKFVKTNGTVAATGYMKSGFVSKKGLVKQADVDKKFGFDRGSCQLSPAITLWNQSEQAMIDSANPMLNEAGEHRKSA